MASEVSPELAAAIAAARAAGRVQRRRFRRRAQRVETKPDDTPVTATDRDSEAIIRRLLAPVIPGCDFLGEETAAEVERLAPPGPGASRWIVDPLDGTKKFVRGLPFFGPCIALERDGRPALGVIHLPALGETWWGECDEGAFLNGRPIRVSPETRLHRAYVAYSNEAEFHRRGWGGALRDLASQTYHNPGFLDLYSYGALAAGWIDAVVMVGEAAWDIAAARVIVEEAGGRLTYFRGLATVYGGTTLATNGLLHPPLLRLLEGYR
jgi:histidinol-phosphatase